MGLQWKFSTRAREMKSSTIREILKITERPDVISFAGGLPAPELFPIKALKEACNRVLDNHGPKSLQYSLTMGVLPLREILAERLSRRGLPVAIENLFITGGSQQGLDLIAKVFLNDGDTLLCENPTYLGAIQAFNIMRPKYVTVEMDQEGMIVEQAEEKIKKHNPRFIYVVADFQNPSGITMSLERRKQLLELAEKYHIPIVDDNPYGELRYVGKGIPSLQSMGRDLVIELGTFSKIISPGLRIGWGVVSTEIMVMFERLKQGADLHTNTFAQYVVYEYIKAGNLDSHIEEIKTEYRKRREVMVEALKEHFPEGVKWFEPEGGLFLWVELPSGISASNLLPKAVEEKVAYVPGKPFYPHEDKDNTLRLNFSNASPDLIREGIKRLGNVFKESIKALQSENRGAKKKVIS
jgi:2-aminoadipate transaminase